MRNSDMNYVDILKKKILAFIESNCGLVEVIDFKEFLHDLPYDAISIEEMNKVMEEFEGVNGTIDFLLLDYSVEQILFYQSKNNSWFY